MKKWSSFSVRSPTEIVHEVSHPMTHDRKSTRRLSLHTCSRYFPDVVLSTDEGPDYSASELSYDKYARHFPTRSETASLRRVL